MNQSGCLKDTQRPIVVYKCNPILQLNKWSCFIENHVLVYQFRFTLKPWKNDKAFLSVDFTALIYLYSKLHRRLLRNWNTVSLYRMKMNHVTSANYSRELFLSRSEIKRLAFVLALKPTNLKTTFMSILIRCWYHACKLASIIGSVLILDRAQRFRVHIKALLQTTVFFIPMIWLPLRSRRQTGVFNFKILFKHDLKRLVSMNYFTGPILGHSVTNTDREIWKNNSTLTQGFTV